MKNLFYVILAFLINSCQMKGQEIIIQGKIALETNDTCTIYSEGKTIRFKLLNENGTHYNSIVWMNRKDTFISAENILSAKGKNLKSNIIQMDTKGKLVERIYESTSDEFVNDFYPSPNDSLLLFTTMTLIKSDPDNLFNSPLTIQILDLKSKKITKRIVDFCPRINFEIKESPWSADNKSFVYVVSSYKESLVAEKKKTIRFKPEDGIYIYSITNDEHTRISESGTHAVWSPKGDIIAYLIKGEIWLYNISKKENSKLIKTVSNEHANLIHWTPDGDYIYAICSKNDYYQFTGNNYVERLIRVSNGESMNFREINFGAAWYTWKK